MLSIARGSLVVAIVLCAAADAAEAQVTFVMEAAGGGGFVGVKVPNVIPQPLFRVDTAGIVTQRTDSTRLVANSQFLWRPAVSTGIVGRLVFAEKDSVTARSLGVGLGFHMVALPGGADASIKLAPALTIHIGSRHIQMFGGLVFTANDKIRFPGGGGKDGDEIITVAGTDHDSFILKGFGQGPSVFLGLIIGGLSITDIGNE